MKCNKVTTYCCCSWNSLEGNQWWWYFHFLCLCFAFHCWGDSLCGGFGKRKKYCSPWIFEGIGARPTWMPKLGPRFLCPGGCSVFVKSGALAAGTFWFHCMKSWTFTVRGSYHRGSVGLQAHIFWEIHSPYTSSCHWENMSQSPQVEKKTPKLSSCRTGLTLKQDLWIVLT